MGVLKALTKEHGDKSVSWDRGKEAEVEAAKQEFEFLTKEKGYHAFKIDAKKPGRKGERIRFFDPLAEEILLVPQMAGG